MQTITHVFTDSGLGQAPFQVVGHWSAPSKALAEQNPTAYQRALSDRPASCKFACAHCGINITHHVIVRSADGIESAVGCDCAGRTGDTKLVSAAKAVKRELAKAKRDAARAAKRAAQEAEYQREMDAQRQRNGGLTDQEMFVQEHERKVAERKERLQPVIDALRAASRRPGDFASSVAMDLEHGHMPRGRGLDIAADIAERAGVNDAWERLS